MEIIQDNIIECLQRGWLEIHDVLDVVLSDSFNPVAHAHEVKVNKLSGVYFLINDNEVVYVGQSKNVIVRVAGHADDKFKVFNKVCVLSCGPANLDVLESAFIHKFRPRYNRQHSSGKMVATISEEKLSKCLPDWAAEVTRSIVAKHTRK